MLQFNDNIYHKFCVPAKLSISEQDYLSSEAKDDRFLLLGDPHTVYAKVRGYYKSTNTISIKRDIIKLEYLDYRYTGVDMELDKDNNAPYEDEFTHEGMKFTVPAKSYYNATERVYFNADELDNRFKFCQLKYEIIPKVVKLPYVFIQDSSFEALAQAEERENAAREEWKDKYLRCCVDTINYDPWISVMDRLKKLFCIWAKLGANDDDLIELPPIELTDMSSETCEKCGKSKDKCTCDDIKLCTKCYPLDFYGLTGKNKLGNPNGDDEANTYGLLTATGYIYDQANHPLSFAEIAHSIYVAVYAKNMYELVSVDSFAFMNKYSLSVLSIDYSMLQSCAQFQIGGTVASSFSENNWKNFIKQYSVGLSSGKNMDSIKFANEFKVGVADGYAYIPVGHMIVFEYNPIESQFTIKGATSEQTALLMSLAACTEEQYMGMWRSIAEACAPLSDDMKKFIAYPYMPSVNNIINGLADKVENPEEYDETYVYIADPSDAYTAAMTKTELVQVRFWIYIKRAIRCSYPKSKIPSCRSRSTDGFCGLRELFERPLILCTYNFDLEKEVLKRKARKKCINMKKISEDLKNNTYDLKTAACNVTKNLQKIDDIKSAAMKEVIDFANERSDLLGMVERDKTNEDSQDSVLCEAILNQNLKSIMEDYDTVFNQTIKAVELIGDDNFDRTKEDISDMIKDFITINDSLKKSMNELAKALPIFMLCNKKYNDYLTEQNLPKPFDVDLIELAKEEYAKDMSQNFTTRIGNNEIRENVIKIEGLKDSAKDDVIENIKNTNFDELKSLIGVHKPLQELTSEGATDDEKAMILIRKECKASRKQCSLMNGLKKETCSNLSPSSCTKSLLEKFTTPSNLLTGMKLTTDIAKCAGRMTKGISSGVESGVEKTVEGVIYPLFGCEPPKNDEKTSKDSLADLTSMDDKIKDAQSMMNNGSIMNAGAEALATAASKQIAATVMTSCGAYLTTATVASAALGGIGGIFSGGENVKASAISGVNQTITSIINTAIEKTGLKSTVKAVISGITTAAKKLMPGITSSADSQSAEDICNNLSKNVGDEIASNLDKALDRKTEETMKSMKNLVEENPMLNEMVNSVLKIENGDLTNAIMGSCNGSGSFSIDNQDNEATKQTIENESGSSDALTQVYKFIKENTRTYQQITGEFVTFDSVK